MKLPPIHPTGSMVRRVSPLSFTLWHACARILRVLVLWLGITGGWNALAAQVVIVGSQPGGTCQTFAEALRALQTNGKHSIETAGNAVEGIHVHQLKKADLIVTTGATALAAVIPHTRKPILATLLSQSQLEEISPHALKGQVYAIVLDQPLERHLRLIRSVLPESKKISLLTSRTSLIASPAVAGLKMHHVLTPQQFAPALEAALVESDALLSLPDPVTASPQNIRPILLSSYRRRRPVFGYSRAYVEAGALAAVFSTPANIAHDVDTILEHWHGPEHPLTAHQPPMHFEISVNRQVARALGLQLPDDVSLRLTLQPRSAP